MVSWCAFSAQAPVCIATETATSVGINACGAIVKQTLPFTEEQHRDIIELGTLVHIGPTIGTTIAISRPPASPYHSLSDLSDAVGILNTSGNAYGAAGANLNLNKTAGTIFGLGTNFTTSRKVPNTVTNAAQLPLCNQIFYGSRDGCGGHMLAAPSSLVDPSKYDNGTGILACVAACEYTAQRIYFSPSSENTVIVYGTAVYCSLAEATGARDTEAIDVSPVITSEFAFRGWVIVKGDATELNDVCDATFIDAGKFGQASGSGATSSTTTLQEAYCNSAEPEIVLACADGAFNIQDACGGICADLFMISNFGGCLNYFKVDATKVVMNAPASAPADCTLDASNITFYLCETCNTIHAKAKESGCGIINKQISTQPHWVINGGVCAVAGCATSCASYGLANAVSGIPMLRAGEVLGLSVSVDDARAGGTLVGRFAIDGTPNACNVVTINACNTTSNFNEFGTPIAYSAGEVITLQTLTTSFTPINADATIVIWVRDT